MFLPAFNEGHVPGGFDAALSIDLAIGIQSIIKSFRERDVSNAEDLIQRAVTSLSISPGSTTTVVSDSHIFSGKIDTLLSMSHSALPYCDAGRRFGGTAQKNTRFTHPKSKQIASVRLCWVCGEPVHFARDCHKPEKVTVALKKRKSENAYVSIHSVSDDIKTATSYLTTPGEENNFSSHESSDQQKPVANVVTSSFCS